MLWSLIILVIAITLYNHYFFRFTHGIKRKAAGLAAAAG